MDRIADSKRIAGLVGPALIAVPLSELLNLGIWTDTPAQVVYLNGAILFVAGLAIVRAHNRWTQGWPVLVTLVGWGALLLGLLRMFAPVSSQQPEQNHLVILVVIYALLAIGILLTVKAYLPEARPDEWREPHGKTPA